MLTTYHDLVDHLLDFGEVAPGDEAERFARRAVQIAIKNIGQQRRWSYFYSPVLIATNASQTTGTIVYDHTGGANERQVTLTDATWPAWASLGIIRIGQVDYEIASRVSTTIITLSENSNPGDDVASTTYTLFRNQYPLPNDFLAMGNLCNQSNLQPLEYVSPNGWQERTLVPYGPGLPVVYTIMGSRNYLNTMTLYFWPGPNTAQTYAGLYQRSMRPVKVANYITGKLTVASDSTSVTGIGTAWTASMEGAVIRFASSADTPPTGLGGSDPFEVERMVVSVESATALTIDAVTGQAYTAKKYRISDPVDIYEGNMSSLLLRECEKQFRMIRRFKVLPGESEEYEMAKVLAGETDDRSFEPRFAIGPYMRWWDGMLPLRYFPFQDGN